MNRLPNWQDILAQELALRRRTPFVWGEHDCVLFTCDVVQAICGVDFAEHVRGRYKTRRGAYMLLRSLAGGGLEQAVEKAAQEYGCEEVSILMARRGDIVLAEIHAHSESDEAAVRVLSDSLGVCLGERAAFASRVGFIQHPITFARRAWRTS